MSKGCGASGIRVGVIASMKRGLEHFIFRELTYLSQQGVSISLFPTKHRVGLYDPDPSWRVQRWSALRVLLCQPLAMLRFGSRYLTTALVAVRHGALIDFLLAAFFATRMGDVDVLYATFGDRKLFVGYFCKHLTGLRLVVAIHAYELYANPNPRLFPRALAACDQVITISDFNRERLHERFSIPLEKIAVVRVSVDLEAFRPEVKSTILIVGFFVERKGHEILFQALRELEDKNAEVWVVGGAGAESDPVDVRELAKIHGVEHRVAFFGELSGAALLALYRTCDVFCLPCHFDRNGVGEGFPSVIIEAMALGKPIVTTRHVEIPNVVEKLLVEEKDVRGLADALDQALSSATLRCELGERNRKLAETYFTSENVARTAELLVGAAGDHSDLRD